LAATEDAAAAFVTAYDAARKSLSAMLAVQGLRARGGDGGHRVLSELMQAQTAGHCPVADTANADSARLAGCWLVPSQVFRPRLYSSRQKRG